MDCPWVGNPWIIHDTGRFHGSPNEKLARLARLARLSQCRASYDGNAADAWNAAAIECSSHFRAALVLTHPGLWNHYELQASPWSTPIQPVAFF